MIESSDRSLRVDEQPHEPAFRVLEKIFDSARPNAVFGEPIVSGNTTVITASEIIAGGGVGFGRGDSPGKRGSAEGPGVSFGVGGGAGGGGGGGARGRAVAVIVITSEGVRVKPIVDVTKLATSGIGAWVAVLSLVFQMRGQIRHALKRLPPAGLLPAGDVDSFEADRVVGAVVGQRELAGWNWHLAESTW